MTKTKTIEATLIEAPYRSNDPVLISLELRPDTEFQAAHYVVTKESDAGRAYGTWNGLVYTVRDREQFCFWGTTEESLQRATECYHRWIAERQG